MYITLSELLERVKIEKSIVLVGAGGAGIDVLSFLRENNINVDLFFDNDEIKVGQVFNGVSICKPYKTEKDSLYVICMKDNLIQNKLRDQLLSFGISEDRIVIKEYTRRTYEYKSNLQEEKCKNEIEKMYYDVFNRNINWESPMTYNEKINVEKLYNRDKNKTRLTDKYLVRDWVKEKIGEEYLTKLYGVWDNPEDIMFESLPSKFALKLNNGSVRNIIVTDKSTINKEKVCEQLNRWKKENFAYTTFEMHYKDIVPKIICEEYLEGVAENLYDYDVVCFHGEPKYIWCIKGSHKPDCKAAYYDLNWKKQSFSYGYPLDEEYAPKPKKLKEMIELSRILSKGFEHVRIDWYEYPKSKNGIIFSEITFSTWGGLRTFSPMSYDKVWGEMI